MCSYLSIYLYTYITVCPDWTTDWLIDVQLKFLLKLPYVILGFGKFHSKLWKLHEKQLYAIFFFFFCLPKRMLFAKSTRLGGKEAWKLGTSISCTWQLMSDEFHTFRKIHPSVWKWGSWIFCFSFITWKIHARHLQISADRPVLNLFESFMKTCSWRLRKFHQQLWKKGGFFEKWLLNHSVSSWILDPLGKCI